MGMIRKTASIATLGLINFRSKSELLDRERQRTAKLERRAAELEQLTDRTQRQAKRARDRAEKAELEALAAEKKSRRERRRATKSAENDIVRAADEVVVAGRRAKWSAKRALKRAGKKAAETVDSIID